MTDLICRKTMMRCQTQGMCAPFGGCQPSVLADCKTAQSNSSEAPSPAGVDGLDVVQAVAWLNTVTKEATTHPVVAMDWDDEKEPVESLMQISQHEAIIDGLRGEVACLAVRLDKSRKDNGAQLANRAAVIGQRDQLAGLLRDANWSMYANPLCQSGLVERCCCRKCVHGRIDAALAELK